MKTLGALSLLLVSAGALAQSYQHLPPHERPPGSERYDHPQYERRERVERNYGRGEPRIPDEVTHRFVERPNGARVKVANVRHCTRSGYDRAGRPVCLNWVVDRDRNVRR